MVNLELYGVTTEDKWLGSQSLDGLESEDKTFGFYDDSNAEEVYKGSHMTMVLFIKMLKETFKLKNIRLSVLPDDRFKIRKKSDR